MRQFEYTNKFEEDLSEMLDGYCEPLTDKEFEWLVSGLHEKLKKYLRHKIDIM